LVRRYFFVPDWIEIMLGGRADADDSQSPPESGVPSCEVSGKGNRVVIG